ncbi:M64 family metallopeptidase [Bacteroidota bacterium]
MKRIILAFLLVTGLLFSSYGQVFDTDTLILNGDIKQRINFVFLGDGYLESELDKYMEDVDTIVDELFNQSPWNKYKSYFNVIAIKVPSNVSGASLDPDNLIDNYFGSTFNSYGIERLLVPMRSSRIQAVMSSNFPLYDQIFVIVNSDKYGGSGGWVATASTNSASIEVAIHELGHSFGGLADEYWAGLQYANEKVNMTQQTNPELVKWKDWMGDYGIGIYSHDSPGQSWKRPHQNCKMRYLGRLFCAVCREELTSDILSLVNQVESYEPENTFVELADDQLFKLNILKPEPNTVKSSWYFEGILIKENIDSLLLLTDTLDQGSYSLRATAIDTTNYIRKSSHFSDELFLVSWDINKTNTGIDIISKRNKTNFSLYPNPANEYLNFEILSENEQKIQLTILSINGIMVYQKTINVIRGQMSKHSINVSSAGMTPGLYLVNIQCDGSLITRKLVLD